MSKRIHLLLILIAALPLAAAQDVLTIGTISATAGSSVTAWRAAVVAPDASPSASAEIVIAL